MITPREAEVGIVGAGPAGLVTALRLQQEGIACTVYEKHTPEDLAGVARAGLLQFGAVSYLRNTGLIPERMDEEGKPHGRFVIKRSFPKPQEILIDYSSRPHTVYPQWKFTMDLIAMFRQKGGDIRFGVEAQEVTGIEGPNPKLRTTVGEFEHQYIVGSDGPKSKVRQSLSNNGLSITEERYPFQWYTVGINASPSTDKLVYSVHPNGLALATLRDEKEQRFHMQYSLKEGIEQWSEKKILDELELRLGFPLKRGPIFARNVIDMRSIICNPMTIGNVILLGDAAHTFSPAGAVGWSAAIGDAALAAEALIQAIKDGDKSSYEKFSQRRTPRIKSIVQQSNNLLDLLDTPISNENWRTLNRLASSESARIEFATRYSGEDIDPAS